MVQILFYIVTKFSILLIKSKSKGIQVNIMNKRLTLVLIYTIFSFTSVIFAQSPVITQQPMNRGVIEGQTATFSTLAQGDSLAYQWYKNDTLIVSATDSVYITPSTVLSDNKSKFKCVVTNPSGSDTSQAATLYVTAIGTRVTEGQTLLYNFNEATGNMIYDNSGVGSPLDMKIDNTSAISWTPKGLGTNDTAFIRTSTSATKVIDASTANNEVTVEAWVVPAYSSQGSLSRIVTLAQGYNNQNFAIMQSGSQYIVRMRSTEPLPSAIGEGIATPPGTVNTKLSHLVFTRRSDGISYFYLDGNLVLVDTGGGDFANWISNTRFQIANDFGEGAWLGTYYLVSVYDRALDQPEVTANFNLGVDNDRKPEIVIEPQDLGLLVGQSAVFSVKYVGDSSSVKWRKNGSDIGGATQLTYTIPAVSLTDNFDEYSCVITNSFGSDTSRNAKLNVTALNSRVTNGQLALYTFQEAAGDTINDVSGYNPLNLKIVTPGAVQWKPYGLFVNSPANIVSVSQASKVNDSVKAKGEFTFEAWIKAANLTQNPATIATLASTSGPDFVNFTINQDVTRLLSWFRTSNSPNSGYFQSSPLNSISDSLIHIVYTHNPKEISKIFINGNLVSNQYDFGNLSNWDSNYFLKLADQFTILSSFKGFYNLVSFYKRALNPTEIIHNFSQGPINILVNNPNNLSAQANQIGKIDLVWQDNSANEDGFIIERKYGAFDFTVLDSVMANVSSFVDSNVVDTTTYTYRVIGYNLFVQSDYTNTASATTPLSTLAAPTTLAAVLSQTSLNHAELTWQDNSSNEAGFIIERKIENAKAEFAPIDTVGANVIAYVDSVLADTTTYSYRVKAFNQFLASDYSNTASVTTLLSTLAAPTTLAAVLSQTSLNHAELTWQDNSSNESGFIIERMIDGTKAEFAPIDTVAANVTAYIDSVLADTTTYSYRVKAFNQFLASNYSNTASVTTVLSTLAAPSFLYAILHGIDSQYVMLNWNDNSSNELGFVIERKDGNISSSSPFNFIDSVGANITSYVDSTVILDSTYTYRVFAYNQFLVSDYSNLADIRVPVELISFVASVINGNVTLKWETATETNNSGFSIQKSKDNVKFTDVTFIKGKGTTTNQTSYSYTDKTALFGQYYYRLKQIDFDGSFQYSKSIEVDLGTPKSFSLEQNYPNPFNPSTTIRFALPISAKVTIKLYNALGQEVTNVLSADLTAGIHETVFNASALSSGVYFYMIKAQGTNGSNYTSTKRMILIK